MNQRISCARYASAARAFKGSVSVPPTAPCSEPSVDAAGAVAVLASMGAVRSGVSACEASTATGATAASGTAAVGIASGVFCACGDGRAASCGWDLAATGCLRCHVDGNLVGVFDPSFNTGVIATAMGCALSLEISA